ncbi:MAG TPA: RDD family protein [Mycobacteriales bacterium]|jgi:uncharacterized RDD family membrane protein YckC
MTTTPPDQPGDAGYGPPPGYGAPGTPPGYGAPGTPPGYGGPGMGAPIPAPPGQWAGPPLAEWPQRVGASLIDGLISGVPYVILSKIGAPGLGSFVQLGLFLYIQYLQGTTGQSPGKKVLNLKLLREADGMPIGFPLAIGRGLLHFLDFVSCLVGFLWPIWDAKKQTFADKIVGSVVIRA